MKILTVLILIIVVNFFAQAASAHVLKTDGSIGAILHIDPDDDPIAGSQAGFFFEFKDTTNKFKPENCDCTFSVIEDGKQIFSQPLFQSNSNPSLENVAIFYTFPEKNVYQVKVTGKPKNVNDFQTFNLNFDVRVDKISQTAQTIPKLSPYLIGAIILIILLLMVFLKTRKGGE